MLLPLLVGAGLLLAGCSEADRAELGRLGAPEPASDRGEYFQGLWVGAWIASGVVMVLVLGLLIYSMVRYRRRSDDEVPVQLRYNLPIEVLYTVAPVIVVAVFFFHTVETQNDYRAVDPDPDHVITAVGQRWAWTFIYEDGPGGEPVYDQGSPDDPTQLYLPVDESVRFELRSPDTIHSFWVPAFLDKQDVMPGRENSISLTPTREGEYAGRCAEHCGLYHSRMVFEVNIVSPEEYQQHLQELVDAGQVGAPEGSDYNQTVDGLDDEEGTE